MLATYYAQAAQLNAGGGDLAPGAVSMATGDTVLLGTTFAPGQPMVEVVKRVLRTPKGSYLPDPTFGIDLSWNLRPLPDAAARLDGSIRQALSFYVSRGYLTQLQVTTAQSGPVLTYEVSFVDPRDTVSNTQTVSGAF